MCRKRILIARRYHLHANRYGSIPIGFFEGDVLIELDRLFYFRCMQKSRIIGFEFVVALGARGERTV